MSLGWKILIRIAISLALIGGCAVTSRAGSINVDGSSVPTLGYAVVAPMGERAFCLTYPQECEPALDIVLDLTAEQLREVQRINLAVNREIEGISDMAHLGVPERWDFAEDGRGDCEDIALVKRRRLMELGLPRGALHLTVVATETGEGHMVLTLRTLAGDFILDNTRDLVMPWYETRFAFARRQDPEHPGRWWRLSGQGRGR